MLKALNNLDELTLPQLEGLALELDTFFFKELKIGEPYSPVYRRNRKAFKAQVKKTVRLRNHIREFFKEQVKRIYSLVKIHLYKFDDSEGVLYGSGGDDYINYTVWQQENDLFMAKIFVDIEALFDIGVMATELHLSQVANVSSLETPAAQFLRNYTMDMVGDLNLTTRNRIIEQIKNSLANGESRSEMVNRITSVIDDPKRSIMIAQTESVRAYSEGRFRVLTDLGYKTKIWVGPQASDDLCPNGEVVKIDEAFSNGEMFPPAHPNCRCGYQQADTLSKDEIDNISNYPGAPDNSDETDPTIDESLN